MDIVRKIENLPMDGSTPKEPVVIADCGEISTEAAEAVPADE